MRFTFIAILIIHFFDIGLLLAQPVTYIISPSAGSWHKENFTVSFSDVQSGSEIILAEWKVISSGVTTLNYTARTVGGNVTVTVGPSALARHQGSNTVTVYGRSTDALYRTSSEVSRKFSIDWTSDQISAFTAQTSNVGTEIPAGSWTSDRDPFFSYAINTSQRYSPIAGYSFAFSLDPDDIPEIAGGDNGSVQLSEDQLSEGQQSFRIKAIDAAGNQGIIYTFDFGVDYTGDIIPSVTAKTEQEGTVIPPSTDQTDNIVWFEWSEPPSTAPISGYKWFLNSNPDAVAETTSNGVSVSLPYGISVFNVRSVDEADNIGPVTSFEIWVSTPTGIYDPEQFKFNLFPNPTSDFVVVQIENFKSDDKLYFALHDLIGALITKEEITEELTFIRFPEYTPGVYILKIFKGEKLIGTRKLIKN